MKNPWIGGAVIAAALCVVGVASNPARAARGTQEDSATPGQLTALDKDGRPGLLVPLKNTHVNVDIAGISARVTLLQTFKNDSRTPIEAVYTFPMSNDAAVDRMRMNVAGRLVVGTIKKREEARVIYDQARANGQVASLLDQERPNVFTQSVANILPGAEVQIEISYVQTLKYEDGQYEFSFPMVVGPRYMPASTPDPNKVDPPRVAPSMRTGTTVSMNVHVDAGAPIDLVNSVLHEVDLRREGANQAYVTLKNRAEIPNRDFILRYKLKDKGIKEQLVTHSLGDGTGTFCLVLNPPQNVQPDVIRPREVVFVMDQSGSQSGFPIEKSKELTLKLIDKMRPTDTFNVVSFSNGARKLWPEPRPNTPANLGEAKSYVSNLQANGGTEFLPAIEMSLADAPRDGRTKLVVFNTDAFVGNEFEILDRIQKYRNNARMFVFGIGNGVNQFLVDAMSVEGRGGSETVTLAEQADRAVERFLARTQSPVLTDVALDFKGVQVTDVSPANPEDLFTGRPVIIMGRYSSPGTGSVTVRGRTGLGSWAREVPLTFSRESNAGGGVTSLWARRAVEDLTRRDWMAQARQSQEQRNETVKAITDIGLKYGIMTAYTSFVAVEQKVVNVGGKQRRIDVPVEMTDGVTFGDKAGDKAEMRLGRTRSGVVGGGGAGFGGGGYGGASASPGKAMPQSQTALGTKVVQGDFSGTVMENLAELGELNRGIKAGRIDPMVKVDKTLHKAKGKVEVQVFVDKLDADTVKALQKAGLTVADQDKNLKVVFGEIDAAKLKELAKVEAVVTIKPL